MVVVVGRSLYDEHLVYNIPPMEHNVSFDSLKNIVSINVQQPFSPVWVRNAIFFPQKTVSISIRNWTKLSLFTRFIWSRCISKSLAIKKIIVVSKGGWSWIQFGLDRIYISLLFVVVRGVNMFPSTISFWFTRSFTRKNDPFQTVASLFILIMETWKSSLT